MPIADVIAEFPSGPFFILVGATLLFGIVPASGTIDLPAYWAERLAGQRRLLVPMLMFLLTALLASAGAFTPAAIAIVAPVALALGARFGISALAMGLVIVQGANAGAFSPVNPFGVLANVMLDEAGRRRPGHAEALHLLLRLQRDPGRARVCRRPGDHEPPQRPGQRLGPGPGGRLHRCRTSGGGGLERPRGGC